MTCMELVGTELDTAGNWKTGTISVGGTSPRTPRVNMRARRIPLGYNIQNSTDFQLEQFSNRRHNNVL